MWFRPRSQSNENERFRVPSIRNRMRSKKPMTKCADTDECDTGTAITKVAATALTDCYGVHSQVGHHIPLINCDDDSLKEKNKVLRVDQKYKKNRITKSSSRSKVHDLKPDKVLPCKCGAAGGAVGQRKKSIPYPPDAAAAAAAVAAAAVAKKSKRRNTSLNLNALLRYKTFISGSTKKLTSDDFDRLRRKSLGDTNAVRRKSNPDTKKKTTTTNTIDTSSTTATETTSDKNKLQPSDTIDSNDLSNDDFQSCDEDQIDDDGTAIEQVPWQSDDGIGALSKSDKHLSSF